MTNEERAAAVVRAINAAMPSAEDLRCACIELERHLNRVAGSLEAFNKAWSNRHETEDSTQTDEA